MPITLWALLSSNWTWIQFSCINSCINRCINRCINTLHYLAIVNRWIAS